MTNRKPPGGNRAVRKGNSSAKTTVAAQWQRRREAARRLPPWADCPCPDPWPCLCYDDREPSPRMLDAILAAVEHLDRLDLPPLVTIETCRLLWRHGERTHAHRLARLAGAP